MNLVHLLRNVSVDRLAQALERDGFIARMRAGSRRVYRHPDGRQVFIHYHRGSHTFPRGVLVRILVGTQWTEEDARRLLLIH